MCPVYTPRSGVIIACMVGDWWRNESETLHAAPVGGGCQASSAAQEVLLRAAQSIFTKYVFSTLRLTAQGREGWGVEAACRDVKRHKLYED